MSETLPLVQNVVVNQIDVGTIILSNLFKNNLSIPDFQRPYEWNERLVLKLFRDIDEHFFFEKKLIINVSDFYLGSVLLNKKGFDLLEIVDGQQRLTTFLILDYLIDPVNCFMQNNSFLFNSNISVKNILEVKRIIEIYKNQYYFVQDDWYREIIQKIRLNVTITSDEHKAFQFFDSLNSKGKKLDTINILKSFHLRELKNEEILQKKIASSFDLLNAKVESTSFKNSKIYSLNNFVSLLWVKHNYWTKGDFSPISNEAIENYFRENSISYGNVVNTLKLFPGIRNMRNTEVTVGENKYTYGSTYEESVGLNMFVDFNPMQPVQKGLGFFLSLEKLQHYFDILFINCEYKRLDKITAIVKFCFNDYFLHLYYLVVLGYYVKFENHRLEEFAFEIEQILGNKFLYLQGVRRESPEVIMRNEFNILQHIYLNIEPDILLTEVVKYKMHIKVQEIHHSSKDEREITIFKFRDKSVEYLSHTSRPQYMRIAKSRYISKEATDKEFIALAWNNNDLMR